MRVPIVFIYVIHSLEDVGVPFEESPIQRDRLKFFYWMAKCIARNKK